MADPRFFSRSAPLSVEVVAEVTGAKLISEVATCPQIKDVSPIETASLGDITFIENRKYVDLVANTHASACFISSDLVDRAHPNLILLLTDRPRRCFATIANIMYPRNKIIPTIHQTATISETAVIGDDCQIDVGVVIGPLVRIGKGCSIGSNVTIGKNVHIGQNTWIGPNASISHTELGADCVIYPGARIGQPGFGFEIDASGPIDMPQLGLVKIGNNVEIGANSCIDKAKFNSTIIGDGCKIDNLVQIGHNCVLGKSCIMAGSSGLAGTVTLGDGVVIGGGAKIRDHLTLGSGVSVGACSGVISDVPDGKTVLGYPATDSRDMLKQWLALKKLANNS